MIYQRPFVTSRFTAYEGDSITRQLSLAVQVLDDFTDLAPTTSINVFLKERRDLNRKSQEPILNLSGYRCFLDVAVGTYTLVTEPDPVSSGYYLKPAAGQPWTSDFEQSVDIPRPDPLEPVVVVRLAPNTGYSFPGHATLVHGRVASGLDPVVGAEVSSVYSKVDPDDFENSINETVSTRTDSQGLYILYFKVPSVTPQNINVVAKANGLQNNKPATLKEGETTAVDTIPLP